MKPDIRLDVNNGMNLEWLPGQYTVCKLASPAGIDLTQAGLPPAGPVRSDPEQDDLTPERLASGDLFSLTMTRDECSLVCPAGREPAAVKTIETGWRAFRVIGPLDFGLVGILAKLATTLAEAGISIFAISTFDTDYILVKEATRTAAETALAQAGWRFPERGPTWT